VIAEMREAGYALESNWFAPHFEFRFPRIGEFAARGARFATAVAAFTSLFTTFF